VDGATGKNRQVVKEQKNKVIDEREWKTNQGLDENDNFRTSKKRKGEGKDCGKKRKLPRKGGEQGEPGKKKKKRGKSQVSDSLGRPGPILTSQSPRSA